MNSYKIKIIASNLKEEYEEYQPYLNCWYKSSSSCTEPDCNNCSKHFAVWSSLKQSLIPEKLYCNRQLLKPRQGDYNSFSQLANTAKNMIEFTEQGKNLYIYSNGITGNGKTTWAIKLLSNYIEQATVETNESGCYGIFINVPMFIAKIKFCINSPDPLFSEVIKLIEKVDLVVWDDIGACELKDFDYQNLLALIGSRTISKLSNIFTSNLNSAMLKKLFDDRMYSRIWLGSEKILLQGCDERGNNK